LGFKRWVLHPNLNCSKWGGMSSKIYQLLSHNDLGTHSKWPWVEGAWAILHSSQNLRVRSEDGNLFSSRRILE
jgi:hypothetical protein